MTSISSDSSGDEESVVVEENNDGDENNGVVNSNYVIEMSPPLAAARDHSYLEESHPLLPWDPSAFRDLKRPRSVQCDSLSLKGTDCEESTTDSYRRSTFELPVLELHGVVLFPGCTIPIKLRNRSMIRYLGRQIHQCRMHPNVQPKVEIGILTYTDLDKADDQEQQLVNILEGTTNRNFSTILRGRLFYRDVFEQSARQSQYRQPRQNERFQDGTSLHPYIGRIGCIATIRHTHERTGSSQSHQRRSGDGNRDMLWSHYEDIEELVITGVGTSRFRIVDNVDDRNKVFMVEELVDDAMARPLWHRPFSSLPGNKGDDQYYRVTRHAQYVWNLSQVTPIPYPILKKFSPWCLMEEILAILKVNSGKENLPVVDLEAICKSNLEPTTFSFWIANNIPLRESHRADLLSTHSTLERLRMVWKEIQKMVQKPLVICCTDCHSFLSSTKDVFTVGGAEGSTSTYVNGGGYIHQITTLRSLVDEKKVVYEGLPSTENSYFPGYSWHIARCRRCARLLGWKFRMADARLHIQAQSEDRPKSFFGFMSSSVITKQL